MSTQVRTPDATGALWRLPPVLCGLAVSKASHPVYLFISSLLLQKGPLAPAVAVMAPQQTPVVMAPQGLSQAPSQPVQPPQSGIATASGAPVVSQVRFCAHYTHRPLHSTLNGAGTVTSARRLAVSWLRPGHTALHSWTCIESVTHAHTSAVIHSHKCLTAHGHKHRHKGVDLPWIQGQASFMAHIHTSFRDLMSRHICSWGILSEKVFVLLICEQCTFILHM